MRPDFHILIIGGGMVGACAAALAASTRELADLRIAVLEARPPTAPPPDDDVELRVSAVSRASERILSAVDAWRLIPSRHLSPYTDMNVWDAEVKPRSAGSIHFSASASSEPNLGHIVENRRVQWALYDCAAFRNRVTVLSAELTALEFGRDQATATLADGRRISALLMIGSDGANSLSRKLAGIEAGGWEYDQHAFVTHVRT
ncbi:MAG: 2-octaprenyl-3-methyl-6-methoxy-1,4-benzoquinol hydroxylase, partial [Steroidobacter sp.]